MNRAGRSNEERKIIFSRGAFITVAAANMQRIGTARDVGGQAHLHAVLPAQVVNVVVVEMDAAILFGALPPVVGFAVPVRTFHRAGRQMDEPAVKAEGADIEGAVGLHVTREIPPRDDRV
jgi:hypothetical protein